MRGNSSILLSARNSAVLRLVAAPLVLTSVSANAANEPVQKMPRMENLEKLTVGPDNHFQVAIGGNEDKIFFTRSSNLATRLYWRGLKGAQALGLVQPLVKAEFDTKDPAISFDGARIAFTSFERQARGDVCVQDVAAEKEKPSQICADEKVASEQPFWLDAQTVGYIRRPIGKSNAQMVSWDLRSREKRVLFEDQIFSAHADAQGRWIVFSSVDGNAGRSGGDFERLLKVYWRKDQKSHPLRVSLPGLSGFPRFDDGGEFLYFAQFPNDTNSDARIDGNDNGVLFRVPAGVLADGKGVVLPEQLTTAEQNCNYPAPAREFLYMTCAFEGTLDVYRIVKTGLIPTRWNENVLLDAYRTSRSIAERTLIINTLRNRFEKYRNLDSLEKVLSQHFLTGEYQAALYYLNFVEAAASAGEKIGYAVLRNILEILQYRARERLDQISPEFVSLLNEKRKILEREKGAFKSFADLALIFVDLSQRDFTKVKTRFSKIKVAAQQSPLEQYTYFLLSRTLLAQKIVGIDDWYRAAAAVAQSAILNDEAKAYVGSVMVSKIAESHKTAAERLSRLQAVRKLAASGTLLDTLLASQESALQVAVAEGDAAEDKPFQEFNKIFAKTSDQYYLNRALAVQAVLTLAEFNKTRVMGFIAANWLAAAKISDTEYMHARDQYVGVVLDKAYGFWAKPDTKSASQVFYSSVRLTDDQEAHLGFVTTLLQENNRKLLDERYASLKSGSFTAANVDFAKAAVLLFDDLARQEKESTELLEQAEKILLGVRDDGSRPAGKHLLLGYVAHQKLLRKMKGFTFDEELSQAAHHQYMIALDLGRKSQRLTAQVLNNLGMLHLQTGNFGMASGYFAAREKLAFENPQAQMSFLWNFSKALYRNGEFPRAAEVSLQGLTLAQQNKLSEKVQQAWTERTAFHLSQADRFKEAAEHYGKLLSGIEKQGDENTLKALLMQGWSLMKTGQSKQAANSFDKVIVLADKSKPRKASGEPNDVLDFRPQRYSALAYGFLAQMSNAPSARIPLRTNRMKIMEGWEDSLGSYALSRENWSRFVLKDCTSQAADLFLSGDHSGAGRQLDECLQRLAVAVEDSGETADETALETLRVTWMLSSRLAEKNISLSAKSMDTYLLLSRRALSKLDSLAGASRPMAVRWLRLSSEQSVLRSTLLSSTKPEYIKPADAEKVLQQIATSERLELLNAEERQTLAAHLAGLQERLKRVGQGK